jgi:cell division septum initiation protein DivIVA
MDRFDRKDLTDTAFDVVLRGYDKRQVEERLRFLGAELLAAQDARQATTQRVAMLEEALNRAQSPPSDEPPGEVNFGARVEKILKLAEDEAAEVRSQAEAAAMALVDQARSQVTELRQRAEQEIAAWRTEANRQAAEQDSALRRRSSELDSTRHEVEQESERIRAQAHAEAEQVRTALAAEVDQLRTAARAEAEELLSEATAEAEKLGKAARTAAGHLVGQAEPRPSGWSPPRLRPHSNGSAPALMNCINCPGCRTRSTRTSTG